MNPSQDILLAEVREICSAFEDAGFQAMLAGGCVRDRLMGAVPNDYDVATTAKPEAMLQIGKTHGWRVVPIGIEHGTIAVVTAHQTVEITTLRHDLACDGRHAQVAFTASFSEDALRRDFTINALYEDRHGEVHDFVGGIADLGACRLRFVGDAQARIREDYLRSLRYFRFLARFGWQPETQQMAAIATERQGLQQLSMERVQAEYNKLLLAPHSDLSLELMAQNEIHQSLFDWYKPDSLAALLDERHRIETQDLALQWFLFLWHGGLFQLDPAEVDLALQNMRMSRKQKRLFVRLARIFDAGASIAQREAGLIVLGEQQMVDATSFERLLKLRVPEIVTLWHGLQERPPAPAVPKDWLLQQPTKMRGKLVETAKICWYLGLWDGKSCLNTLPRIQSLLQKSP